MAATEFIEEPGDLGLGWPEVGTLNLGLRPDTIHGPLAQKRWRSTLTDSGRWLISWIAVDSEQLWTWIWWRWKGYEIIFPTYKDLLKRTPYVFVASILVQTVSGIREGNEVKVEDESDFNVYVSDAAMPSSLVRAKSPLKRLLLCSSCHVIWYFIGESIGNYKHDLKWRYASLLHNFFVHHSGYKLSYHISMLHNSF